MSGLRARRFGAQALACVFTVTLSVFVVAQASFNTTLQTTDFSGEWTEIPHEIGFTAELYDYSGLPVNAAGRMRYDTGDISEWSIPEFVCRPHPGVYNWFYGGGNRITKEIDPITRRRQPSKNCANPRQTRCQRKRTHIEPVIATRSSTSAILMSRVPSAFTSRLRA